MFKFENVNVKYVDEFFSLLNFSFKFSESFVLIGDKLSGANTVLRLIAKFDKTYSGEIFIDEKNIKKVNNKELDVAFVSEEPYLFKLKNLEKNIGYSLKIRKYDKNFIENEVKNAINKYNLKFLSKKIKNLSVDEKKIITLLRAVIRKPKYLLLEYFFDNLNPKYYDLCKNIIEDYCSNSIILACEYNPCEVLKFKTLIFNNGVAEKKLS